jgi:hypothetical protein
VVHSLRADLRSARPLFGTGKRGLGLAGVGLLVWSAIGLSEQTLSKIPWSQLEREGKLQEARVLPADARTRFETLQIENVRPEGHRVTLLVLNRPGVTSPRWYALRGQVPYERMEGTSYLEMWSVFKGGGEYFSRTLAGVGPLASLTGHRPGGRSCSPSTRMGRAFRSS